MLEEKHSIHNEITNIKKKKSLDNLLLKKNPSITPKKTVLRRADENKRQGNYKHTLFPDKALPEPSSWS